MEFLIGVIVGALVIWSGFTTVLLLTAMRDIKELIANQERRHH